MLTQLFSATIPESADQLRVSELTEDDAAPHIQIEIDEVGAVEAAVFVLDAGDVAELAGVLLGWTIGRMEAIKENVATEEG